MKVTYVRPGLCLHLLLASLSTMSVVESLHPAVPLTLLMYLRFFWFSHQLLRAHSFGHASLESIQLKTYCKLDLQLWEQN